MQTPLEKTIEMCSEEAWASFQARGDRRTVLKLEERGPRTRFPKKLRWKVKDEKLNQRQKSQSRGRRWVAGVSHILKDEKQQEIHGKVDVAHWGSLH